jgi:hypothetical protein
MVLGMNGSDFIAGAYWCNLITSKIVDCEMAL